MNLALLRSFQLIAELGSLTRAAERMRVSQSTLTRQMQALEQEIGGRLLERGPDGVALTQAGNRLIEGLGPLLSQADALLTEVGQLARGKSSVLRIGYLMSIAPEYLNPALKRFREIQPSVKLIVEDLSPGEQLAALRAGRIDLAMIGETDPSIGREFFVKSYGALPMEVALAEDHPLAGKKRVGLAELRGASFISIPDRDVPGYVQWLGKLCRRAGFRPRFGDEATSLTHALSLVAAENLVTLLPRTHTRSRPPGIVFRPLAGDDVRWNMLVAWQRGKVTEPVRDMIDALGRVMQTALGNTPPAKPRAPRHSPQKSGSKPPA